MSSFKFCQKKIAFKDLSSKVGHWLILIGVNKVMLSDSVSCSNRKDWWYIVGYQVNKETNIPLFIKTSENILRYGVTQYDKNAAYRMILFNISEVSD